MVLRSRVKARAYQLHGRIAAGGMGEVYDATAADMNRKVAVKRMLDADASDEDLKLMFLREVAVAATLEHVNVVEVIDAGQNGNELFLVMELVDGPSLAEIMEVLRGQNRILPVEISCHIVNCVAQGLTHAHERSLPDGTPLGIVHRDVAPENVLVGVEGIPKLVDFGLAKLSGHSLTQPGVIRGRPRSLSPEQARGDAVDARSDIFSLGAMLFELVAGQPLYGASDQMATLLYKVAAGDYPPIEPRLKHVDPDLVAVIRTAIRPDPAERFRSARELDRQLDTFRAARGMRVSTRTVAQVVTVVKPAVDKLREGRMEGSAGELDGAKLMLPADRLDTMAEVKTAAKDSSGGAHRAGPAPKPQMPRAQAPKPQTLPPMPPPPAKAALPPPPAPPLKPPPTGPAVAARSASLTPTPEWAGARPFSSSDLTPPGDLSRSVALPPAGLPGELPKPAAPAKALQEDSSELGWAVYLGLILLVAGAVFAGVWWSIPEAENTAPVAGTSAPALAE